MTTSKPENIDQYIAAFPKETQKLLQQVRATIQKAAPEAKEAISYGIPTFTLGGNLVHFAGYKNHIGLYPAPRALEAFKKELSIYKGAKGSVQFPLDKPMPLDLIARITKYRVVQNLEKAAEKAGKKGTAKTTKSIVLSKEKPKPVGTFMETLVAPARRALEGKGIKTLHQLAKHSEAEILALHGMGPSTLPKLRKELKAAGLAFKK